MKRWNVMISAPYMQPVPEQCLRALTEHGAEVVVVKVNERLSEEELLNLIGEFDAVICGDDRFTERVLRSARKLKVISKWGTGIDSIDREACRRLGIAVCNTPNAFSEPVADSVFAYMLCFARQTLWMDREMKQGRWEKLPGCTLGECTLGIIGVGNVGRAVIRRAIAFGMRVLGNDVAEVEPEFRRATGVEILSREEVLRQSDFVSIHCDLNPSSYHLMDAMAFGCMKSNACLINTARGPIVDELALIHALQQGRIAGAGLDVFEMEPLPPESPLRYMDNVLLAPHNSNSSPAAWERVHTSTVRNLIEALETGCR